MIDRLEQIDEKHFYMHLKYPYSIIQYELSGNGFSIISHKSTDDNIIACGPYKLAKHVSGDRIELERFDDFYEETPITKRIIFRIIPETTARVIALETGEIDVADDVPVVERARIAGNPELKLHEVVTSCTEMIYLNCAKGPTSDIRVRQALAMATNREELTLAVTNGTGVPSSTPHPINVPYRYKGEGLPYNPEEAKKLLAEAGYPDGFSLQIVLRNSTHKMIAEMLQAQWKEIGVKVDVQFTEVSTFFDRINNGRFEAYLLVNNNSKGDVYKTLEEFYSPNAGMKGDRMLYKNDRVDKLFDIIKESSDERKREEAGIEIQKIVMKEVPAIPLFCPTDAIGGRKGVEGIAVSPGRTTYFGDIYRVKAN
jgi:peptide/nickel transport system substrate-binding protein